MLGGWGRRHRLYPVFTLTHVCTRAPGSLGIGCVCVYGACRGCQDTWVWSVHTGVLPGSCRGSPPGIPASVGPCFLAALDSG